MNLLKKGTVQSQFDPAELNDWYGSLDSVAARYDSKGVAGLMHALRVRARNYAATNNSAAIPIVTATPYLNTIPTDRQPDYPGDLQIEKRIRNLIRWNAMAMVVWANQEFPGIGGHLASYASAATLFEVGLNHFFHAPAKDHFGDFVYFQGHSSPGIYSRAFLEGRLNESDLEGLEAAKIGIVVGPALSSAFGMNLLLWTPTRGRRTNA